MVDSDSNDQDFHDEEADCDYRCFDENDSAEGRAGGKGDGGRADVSQRRIIIRARRRVPVVGVTGRPMIGTRAINSGVATAAAAAAVESTGSPTQASHVSSPNQPTIRRDGSSGSDNSHATTEAGVCEGASRSPSSSSPLLATLQQHATTGSSGSASATTESEATPGETRDMVLQVIRFPGKWGGGVRARGYLRIGCPMTRGGYIMSQVARRGSGSGSCIAAVTRRFQQQLVMTCGHPMTHVVGNVPTASTYSVRRAIIACANAGVAMLFTLFPVR